MSRKGFVLHSVLVFILLVSLVLGGLVLWRRGKVSINREQILESVPTSRIAHLRVPPTCLSEGIVTYDRGSDERDGKITVIKKDEGSGETNSFEIENVLESTWHSVEIKKCYLYAERNLNGNKSELWRYNFDNSGEKIYESQTDLDFNIPTSEKLIAIYSDLKVGVLNVNDGEIVAEISLDGLKSRLKDTPKYMFDALDIQLRGWNVQETELWGSLYAASVVEAFWKLNIKTGEFEVFSDLYEPTPNGVILNPDREVYAYIDKPLFFDYESYEEWSEETASYSIYIYSLRDKTSTLVDTLPSGWAGGMLTPLEEWDSPNEFRYSTPTGEKIYTLED